MPVRRPKHPTPSVVVDGDDQVLKVGGQCSLFVDMPTWETAPAPGDWIATKAGSRYLVDRVRVVRRRSRTPRVVRHQLRTLRLPKHATAPDDVRVIWLSWYPRGRA